MTIDEFMRKLVARAETIVFPKTPKTINNIPVFYFEVVLSALRGPQPNPETGLVPCGCGGVPVVVNEPGSWGYYLERWHIRCCEDPWKRERCGMRTSSVETKEEAKRIWNTAMGWKGGLEVEG